MAICAVCSAPCRGKCTRCGASLCATHRPASGRAKCAACKKLRAGVVQAVQAIPAYPMSTYPTPAQPMALPIVRPHPGALPLATLALADQLAWVAEHRAQLRQKQARERAYLDRRAARGAHTPTDDSYEADALLEDELFEALDLLENCLQGSSSAFGGSSTYAGDTSMLFPDPGYRTKIKP